MKKDIVVIDLDGVIATGTTEEVYSDEAGWAFEKCEVMEGAKEGLERLSKEYDLILSSARWHEDFQKTIKWLQDNDILQYFKKVEVGQKHGAYAYIDDRAIRFKDWEDLIWRLKRGVHLVRAKQEDVYDTELMEQLYEVFKDKETIEMLGSYERDFESNRWEWFAKSIKWDIDYNWYIVQDGEVIGWIVFRDIDSDAGWLTIALKPSKTGKGIGREAMRLYFIEIFEKLRFRKMFLSVYSFNRKAVKFYEKLGLKFEAEVTEFIEYKGQLYSRLTYSLGRDEYYARKSKGWLGSVQE